MFSCAGKTWLFSFQISTTTSHAPSWDRQESSLVSQHHWHIHADVSHQLLPRLPHCYPAPAWIEQLWKIRMCDWALGATVLNRIQPVCPSLYTLPNSKHNHKSPSVSLKGCHHKTKQYVLFITTLGLRHLAWHPVTKHTPHINWGNRLK